MGQLGQLPPQNLQDLSSQLYRSALLGQLGQLGPLDQLNLTIQLVLLVRLNDVHLFLPRLKEPLGKLYRFFH